MNIVERLQNEKYDCCNDNLRCNGEIMTEAANEIERLRQKNEKLEEQNSMLNQMVINLIGKEVAHVKVHKPKATGDK